MRYLTIRYFNTKSPVGGRRGGLGDLIAIRGGTRRGEADKHASSEVYAHEMSEGIDDGHTI